MNIHVVNTSNCWQKHAEPRACCYRWLTQNDDCLSTNICKNALYFTFVLSKWDVENIDSHKFAPEISLCLAKAKFCGAFCDGIPLGVIWTILQLSGPGDLDLGSGSRSYRCASVIEYWQYTKFDRSHKLKKISCQTWLGPKFRGHVMENED